MTPPATRPGGAKERDYWWTVVAVDPLALPLTRSLAKSGRFSPDAVTLASIVLGVPTGFAFATGSRWGLVAGGMLFYFSFLLDCVDGKLARELGVTSPTGKILDDLGDGARRASASFGLAVYLWKVGDGDATLFLALAYGLMAFYFALISGDTRPTPATTAGGSWSRWMARRRLLPTPGTPDVAALVFIIGPVTGLVVPALIIGDTAFALAILLVVIRLLRR